MGVLNNAMSFAVETLRYKGRAGQWAWILHRAAGIGVFIFLSLHIFDIFLVGFGPDIFNTLTVIYHHPLMRIGHIFLFFGVLFHAVNGVRLVILDLWPHLWSYERRSVWLVAVIFLAVFIPTTMAIVVDILAHL